MASTTPEYEVPQFSPTALLRITGIAERRLQHWIQRDFFDAPRPGRGVHREYSLADVLRVKSLAVLADARVPLDEGAATASYLFPAFAAQVPFEIVDQIQSAYQPDRAPQLFAVFHDGRRPLIVEKSQMDEAWAPIHEGEDWSIVVDIGRLVRMTVKAADQFLVARNAR